MKEISKKDLIFVFGTRPEYQKLKNLMRICSKNGLKTKAFYIPHKKNVALENLLKKEDYSVRIFYKKPGDSLFHFVQNILKNESVSKSIFIVSSDTTVAASTAIFTKNFDHELVKIDAGLRRGDFTLPEDKNSIISDHLAFINFCSSENNKNNLINESFNEKIYISGSTLIDNEHFEVLNKNLYHNKNGPIIISVHRKETLQDTKKVWVLLREIAKRNCFAKIIIHCDSYFKIPRSKFIEKIEPLSHKRFLDTISKSRLIITDSQNLQEETCFLGTPCVTLLEKNNRPETILCGHTKVLNLNNSLNNNLLRSKINRVLNDSLNPKKYTFPYKNQEKPGEYIFNIIKDILNK